MASARLYDFSGDLKGKVELPESLFGGAVNRAVIYAAVRQYLAARRSGSAKTKERGEVRFGTRKPYRQKGTGRARSGRRSSPIWRGGGVVFGPKPRDYGFSLPRKVKRMALKSALADKGRSGGVAVIEGIELAEPKTKRFAEFLKVAGLSDKRVLFVVDSYDEKIFKSVRNIKGVEPMLGGNVNTYKILRADVLLMTREALARLEEVFAR